MSAQQQHATYIPTAMGRILGPRSSAEDIQFFFDAIENCGNLENGMLHTWCFRDIIDAVYEYGRSAFDPSLQKNFIRAVTTSLLNQGLPGGSPRRTPWDDQVECIRRIIYYAGDTILLAKTGYGKSLILQAVSVIRSRTITIQIVPLSQLGQEQTEVVARFPFANPILIDQNTRKVSI